jgi:peptidyl-prolyl cis-trans isomerase A (cyclophilin A)
MRRALPFVVLALAAAPLATLLLAQSDEESASPVTATLELSQQFYYAGDPFFVRISIGNNTDEKLSNPVKTPLLAAFDVRADGAALEAKGKAAESEPARPGNLAPLSFYGTVVDLTKIYPDLAQPGEYQVSWSADGVSSQTLIIKMLPKYDPSKSYVAEVETDSGKFVIDLARDRAPVAVKAFIDMANAGFYEGLSFHEVRKDQYVATGDPRSGAGQRVPVVYPAELAQIPVVTGSVVMKPVRASPPANASLFMIVLRPEPTWTGQVTVFGQITEGLGVARAISRVPSSPATDSGALRPNEDIRIRTIRIKEREPAAAGG